jgi:hypothetical protein
MIKWLPVIGYEKLYEVSSHGEVRRVSSVIGYRIKGLTRTWEGRTLKQKVCKKGYYNICLCKDNVKKFYRVHILVASTFYKGRPEGLDCAHLDGNKANNNISNLKFVTRKENESHKVIHGTRAVGDKNGNSKKARLLRKLN